MKQCQNCTCWKRVPTETSDLVGQCKRFPPTVLSELVCIFPTTDGRDCCAEWNGKYEDTYSFQDFDYNNPA